MPAECSSVGPVVVPQGSAAVTLAIHNSRCGQRSGGAWSVRAKCSVAAAFQCRSEPRTARVWLLMSGGTDAATHLRERAEGGEVKRADRCPGLPNSNGLAEGVTDGVAEELAGHGSDASAAGDPIRRACCPTA